MVTVVATLPIAAEAGSAGPLVIVGGNTKAAIFDSRPRWSVAGSPILNGCTTWTPLTPAYRPAGTGDASATDTRSGATAAAGSSKPSTITSVVSPRRSRPWICSVLPTAIAPPAAFATASIVGC